MRLVHLSFSKKMESIRSKLSSLINLWRTCCDPSENVKFACSQHHQQILRRSLPSSSSVLVASVQPLISHVNDGTAQRLGLLHSHLVLSLKFQARELQKLSQQVFRQIIEVVQRLNNVFCSRSERFQLCQNCVSPMGSLGSSFCKERRT